MLGQHFLDGAFSREYSGAFVAHQKLEALQKARERKRDTRRKILIGAYFMDKAAEEGGLDTLFNQLDGYLKRNSDRELFQLDPLHDGK